MQVVECRRRWAAALRQVPEGCLSRGKRYAKEMSSPLSRTSQTPSHWRTSMQPWQSSAAAWNWLANESNGLKASKGLYLAKTLKQLERNSQVWKLGHPQWGPA